MIILLSTSNKILFISLIIKGFLTLGSSGPVSLLASAHVTAAVKGAYLLEHAVNEISWRADILSPREQIEKGKLWFPGGKGLGAILNASMLKKHGRIWIP